MDKWTRHPPSELVSGPPTVVCNRRVQNKRRNEKAVIITCNQNQLNSRKKNKIITAADSKVNCKQIHLLFESQLDLAYFSVFPFYSLEVEKCAVVKVIWLTVLVKGSCYGRGCRGA